MQCRALALVQLQPSNVDFKPREAVLWCYEIVAYDQRSSQMLWSCASLHSIPAGMPLKLLWQVVWCLSNCRDVPTLNYFGWTNIVPLHNSTLSNVDIKQMWCLVLALSQLSRWTGDVKISGEFAPCRIHNWHWLAIEFASNADVKYDAMWCFGASTTVEMNQRKNDMTLRHVAVTKIGKEVLY